MFRQAWMPRNCLAVAVSCMLLSALSRLWENKDVCRDCLALCPEQRFRLPRFETCCPRHRIISCAAKGLGHDASIPNNNAHMSNMFQHIVESVEDMVYQEMISDSLSKCNPLRSLEISDSTVYLLGTNHVSLESARLAKHVIRQYRPSALLVEICKERLSYAALKGKRHRTPSAKSFFDIDDLETPEVIRRGDRFKGAELRAALKSFANLSQSHPKLLVLGDLLNARQQTAARSLGLHEDFDVAHPELVKLRDEHIAANVWHAASRRAFS
eukprot:TRINITY_DN65750_c0_g1_i1.p1 TRINITY_DN65750_c0_g1~~TRINITY_DN65750_c0_g1_i1.p1  ORF type:complete len:270 (+),score=42.76 TRINITY_DN65750_c0_g1_i1:54-863(+)